jgi:hypothetical protein
MYTQFICSEPFAVKKLLNDLIDVLSIAVLTTDRSSQIKTLMR